MEKRIPRACPYRPAGDVWRFLARERQGTQYFSMLSMLANTPWFQFNPLRLMNANKGVFGVNVGHMWDEIDRLRGWGEALMELAARGIVRPKVAASFKFDDAPKAHHFIQDRRNIGKVLLVP